MNTFPNQRSEPAWKSAYVSAIFAGEREIPFRVAAAQAALRERLSQLPYCPEARSERERIENALRMLRLLLINATD
jgi:hypothetical protein